MIMVDLWKLAVIAQNPRGVGREQHWRSLRYRCLNDITGVG